MTLLVALISVVVFVLGFVALRIVSVARSAVSIAIGTLQLIRAPSLDDDALERAVQKASISLFGAFVSILLRFFVTLVIATVPIWVADAVGIVPAAEVVAYLSRIDVIVVLSVAMLGGWILWARLQRR